MTVNFTRGLSNWTTGTATATNGSATVSFTGANLIAADPSDASVNIYVAGEGDMFIVDGIGAVPIKSVDSASQVTLDYPWPYATQTNHAYRIRRYNEVKTGEVAKHIQAAQTIGQDSNPFVTVAADDGVARVKLRESGGAVQIAVGAAGAADASLKAGLSVDPSSGVVSFPKGMIQNNPGFRNRIINGNFDIWQRGTSFSVSAGAYPYIADRWIVTIPSGATATASRIAAPSGFLGKYALNIALTAMPAGSYTQFMQRCEARTLRDLEAKNCVASFDINASTSAGSLSGSLIVYSNATEDDGGFSSLRANLSFTVPTGSGRVSVPLSAAQMTGIKNGAGFVVRIAQNTAQGDVSVSLGAVQFEADPSGAGKANPFEFRPLAIELAMCQRYCEKSFPQGVSPAQNAGIAGSEMAMSNGGGAYSRFNVRFRVEKRATPTVTLYNPSAANAEARNASAAADCSSTALETNGSTGFVVQTVSPSGSNAGQQLAIHWLAESEL